MARNQDSAEVLGDREVPMLRDAVAVKLAWIGVVRVFACFVGTGMACLMAWPVAHEIAGKQTDFTLHASASLNAVLMASTAMSVAGYRRERKRAARLAERNVKLEQRRMEGLDAKISESTQVG